MSPRTLAQLAFAVALTTHMGVADPLIIQGGLVVNGDYRRYADVLVNGTLVVAVEEGIKAPPGFRVLDARGKLVMPGGIDPHTHLDMPFMGTVSADSFYTGHRAALAGGTTMHLDFVLPVHGDISAGLKEWRRKAAEGCIDYGFHVAVTQWSDKVAEDMASAVAAGVNSFKFFLAYKGVLMVTDEHFLRGLQRCKELSALAMVHAENGDAVALGQQATFEAGVTAPWGHALSRPAALEGEATSRAIRLAHFIDTPLYVVHVMSADAMHEIAEARMNGAAVIGEVVTSGLALDETYMRHPDPRLAAQYVMSPPIRSTEHQRALRGALAGGVLSLVGTDHAAFNSTQKALGIHDFRKIPNGVNGIEERLHVVWETMVNTGRMSYEGFVRVTSMEAAKVFNIYPKKGAVQPGSDADIIILDPLEKHTISARHHLSAMDTNVYEGFQITGKVVTTISRGRLAWDQGRVHVSRGSSRFVRTPAGGPLFAGLNRRGLHNPDTNVTHAFGVAGSPVFIGEEL